MSPAPCRPTSLRPSGPAARWWAWVFVLVGGWLAGGAALAAGRTSLLHNAPDEAPPGQRLQVDGTLMGGASLERLLIRFRGPGQSYREVRMELEYGDLFRGYIPAESMTAPGVEYYVEGITYQGERVPVFRSAERPARVLVLGTARGEPARTAVRPPPAPVPSTPPPSEARPPPAPTPAVAQRTEPPPPARPEERRPASVPIEDVPPPVVRPGPSATAPRPAAPARPATPFEEDAAVYGATDLDALARRQDLSTLSALVPSAVYPQRELRALGARTVHDVLDVVPGLTVSRDVQGYYRTAVRGLRSDAEVLFLLDGQRLNNPYDGRALASLPVENLERIEVIRGPGAARYGGAAVLAVVNLVTRKDEGVRAALAGGSFSTLDGHLNGATRLGALSLHADADVLVQEGFRADVERDGLTDESLEEGVYRHGAPAGRTDDSRRLVNAGAGATWALSAGGQVRLGLRYLQETRGVLVGQFDTVGQFGEEDSGASIGWRTLLANLSLTQPLGAEGGLHFDAWANQQDVQRLYVLTRPGFTNSFAPAEGGLFPDGVRERMDYATRTLGAEASAHLRVAGAHDVRLGLSAELLSLTGYAYLSNYDATGQAREGFAPASVVEAEGAVRDVLSPMERGSGAAASRLVLAAHAEDRWRLFERLSVDVGLRVEAHELPRLEGGTFAGRQWVPSVNPRVGVAVAATDALLLRATYGRAFRAPTIQELAEELPTRAFSFGRGRFSGNPELEPSLVDTVEVGGDLVDGLGAGAQMRLRGDLFFSRLSRAIDTVDASGSDSPVTNRSGVRVWGAEGEARVDLSRRSRLFVNASFFRAMDEEMPDDFALLTAVPQARFNAGGSLPVGPLLNLDVLVRVGAERRNTARTRLELLRRYRLPAYGLVTAQVRTEPLFGRVELVLLGQNLFDASVPDDPIRPDRMPGLLPRAGLSGFLLLRGSL